MRTLDYSTMVAGSFLAAFSKVTSVRPDEWLAPWIKRSTKPGLAVARFGVESTLTTEGLTLTPP